eukprot:5880166-Pyramimonas_sp.AAC.1
MLSLAPVKHALTRAFKAARRGTQLGCNHRRTARFRCGRAPVGGGAVAFGQAFGQHGLCGGAHAGLGKVRADAVRDGLAHH